MTESEPRTPKELHAAVSKLSDSPFADLEVHINDRSLPQDFIDEWVSPYYMRRLNVALPLEIKLALKSLLTRADTHVLSRLLGDFNWRPRVVAARFAALKGAVDVEPNLGRLLLRSDVCFAGRAYAVTLATFNTPTGVAFLTRYLDYYLTRNDLPYDQETIMAAIAYLDRINGTSNLDGYRELWDRFTRGQSGSELSEAIDAFALQMDSMSKLRADLAAL